MSFAPVILAATLCVLLVACVANSPPPPPGMPLPAPAPGAPTPDTPPAVVRTPAPVAPSPPRVADQAVLPSRLHRLRSGGLALAVFVCDDRQVSFALADQEEGVGTQWGSAEAAGSPTRSLAAINGGFFDPAGAPLGLVIENGKTFGRWNSASSLTSGVFAVRNGRPLLQRSSSWSRGSSPDHLLQTGPFLVENGAVVSGLSTQRPRPRSFLLWDGRHHWALGYAESGSLAALATALAAQPVPGLRIQTALNLDGGSSSQLWISSRVKGGPAFHRPLWRKPVRNFILARAKQ